ncbi:MAG TPA: NAD(P)/FAD-dependent oxidoreductase [Steroidobacteraceae bacterium]|nr:NAD(P)/FAD-dependent oxidoreductase [Steroidobacteraceae bacterium]
MTALTPAPVRSWLERFAAALAAPEGTDWSALFAPGCFWRDFVAFSWNIITVEGVAAVTAMVTAQARAIGARNIAPDDPALPMTDASQGWFTFETRTARCRGHVRLDGTRAGVLVTTILELKGYEEPAGARRTPGLEHQARKGRQTWADESARRAATLGITDQPYCLIVGGGQNGLQLAARLKRLAVPALVVDALPRPGDSWRMRYPSLHLHDPIFLDHFPYLPFPDHWPLFTHKDRMADWLEIYARVMEIDFWGGTRCISAVHDPARGEWLVRLVRDGRELTLRPRQLVLATGMSGARHMPVFPGAERFGGLQYHSADHKGGKALSGKRCVVIGSNNSAHDICADLWEADAEVTMVQRSATVVVRADTMQKFASALPYADPAIPSEFADLMAASVPFRLRYEPETRMTAALNQIDAEFYARLRRAGFQLHDGHDGTGFLMAYHRRAAGYYIDVGASDLISSGEIRLAQGEISEITAEGIRLADGTVLPADVIIYATGYRPMHEWVGRLISPAVEAKVGPCWGLGSGTPGDPGPWEGELRNMWKPTAQEGLWFQGGNLMQARFHSLHLALQLKARMEDLEVQVYPRTG